jgi:hypothetical protein
MTPQTAIAPLKAKRHSAFVGVSRYPSDSKTSGTAEAHSKKHRSYRLLATRFQHDGFDYRQIVREGSAAIYEQIWNSCANAAVCYEVVRIRQREGFQIGDRFVEPAELYPNSEAWGAHGWTMQDRDAAFRKLRAVAVSEGAIRSVVLRRRGTSKGKRLVDCAPVRAFLASQPTDVDPQLAAKCRNAVQIRREKEKAEKAKRPITDGQ